MAAIKFCPVCWQPIENCQCDWQDNEEPLSEDIQETDYDGDGI